MTPLGSGINCRRRAIDFGQVEVVPGRRTVALRDALETGVAPQPTVDDHGWGWRARKSRRASKSNSRRRMIVKTWSWLCSLSGGQSHGQFARRGRLPGDPGRAGQVCRASCARGRRVWMSRRLGHSAALRSLILGHARFAPCPRGQTACDGEPLCVSAHPDQVDAPAACGIIVRAAARSWARSRGRSRAGRWLC